MTVYRSLIADIDCLISEPANADHTTDTLICLHGIGGDDASFAPQSEGLSDQFRVVAWNMPGYRLSAKAESLSFASLAESVVQLIDGLDVGPVHLVGQSIGGMIAQEIFHRYPEYFQSGKISSLIPVATTAAFGGRDDTFKQSFLQARLRPLDDGLSMQQVAEAAIPAIVAKNADPQVIDAAIQSMAALPSDVYRQILDCLITFNRWQEWQSIDCPVCLVAGTDDTNAPAATMKKMADKLPHATYHEIENTGHLVNLEQGAAFNEIVRHFINKCR